MTNYVITYTIEDDDVRTSINDFINGLGNVENVDQSTRFLKNYNNTKKHLISILQAARFEYQMDETDTLLLFYGSNDNGGKYSIFKEVIE